MKIVKMTLKNTKSALQKIAFEFHEINKDKMNKAEIKTCDVLISFGLGQWVLEDWGVVFKKEES